MSAPDNYPLRATLATAVGWADLHGFAVESINADHHGGACVYLWSADVLAVEAACTADNMALIRNAYDGAGLLTWKAGTPWGDGFSVVTRTADALRRVR